MKRRGKKRRTRRMRRIRRNEEKKKMGKDEIEKYILKNYIVSLK